MTDATALTGRLTEIFKERETNGVYREGTNEIEKTIFIKSPTSVRYGDVVKVIDAAKMAGAQPIGLQIDDKRRTLLNAKGCCSFSILRIYFRFMELK